TPTVLSPSKPSNAYPRSLDRGFSFLLPDLLTRRTGGLSLFPRFFCAIPPPLLAHAHPPTPNLKNKGRK
ncbi:MAG: hypothetical protein ACKN87_07385, partial [Microcystis aeruginosa]